MNLLKKCRYGLMIYNNKDIWDWLAEDTTVPYVRLDLDIPWQQIHKEALAVKATLTDQSAALTAAQKEIQSTIDLKSDVASGNTSSVEPELS